MASEADIYRLRKELDTSQIKHWRSIVTLVVFIITSQCCSSPTFKARLILLILRYPRRQPGLGPDIPASNTRQCFQKGCGGLTHCSTTT